MKKISAPPKGSLISVSADDLVLASAALLSSQFQDGRFVALQIEKLALHLLMSNTSLGMVLTEYQPEGEEEISPRKPLPRLANDAIPKIIQRWMDQGTIESVDGKGRKSKYRLTKTGVISFMNQVQECKEGIRGNLDAILLSYDTISRLGKASLQQLGAPAQVLRKWNAASFLKEFIRRLEYEIKSIKEAMASTIEILAFARKVQRKFSFSELVSQAQRGVSDNRQEPLNESDAINMLLHTLNAVAPEEMRLLSGYYLPAFYPYSIKRGPKKRPKNRENAESYLPTGMVPFLKFCTQFRPEYAQYLLETYVQRNTVLLQECMLQRRVAERDLLRKLLKSTY